MYEALRSRLLVHEALRELDAAAQKAHADVNALEGSNISRKLASKSQSHRRLLP